MCNVAYKSLTDNELECIFENNSFMIPLRKHQLISLSFVLGEDLDRVMYLHDIGTGKTLTALYTLQIWNTKKTLVVCPSSAFSAWKRDIEKYTDFSYIILTGTADERKEKIQEKRDIYIINYEGLKSLYGNRIKGKGWIIDEESFINNFDSLIVDEIHRCINPNSLQSRICHRLSWKASHAIGLTGTPISSSMEDLWAEFHVIDLGEALGNNYYQFRRRFFKKAFFDWEIKKDSKEKILKNISISSIAFDRNECIDLPKEIRLQKSIEMSEEQKKAESDLINKYSTNIEGKELSVENALTFTAKLRQIAGGFLYIGDQVHRFYINPKLESLMDCIYEIEGKIVIFHQFIEEGRMIEEHLIAKKIEFSSYRSETEEKEKQEIAFRDNSEVKVMVAHPACAKESLDFSFCSTMIFYSNGYSFLEKTQAEGRILRSGQTEKCVFIDLLSANTIDEITCKRIQDKSKLSEEVLAYVRNYHTEKTDNQYSKSI